MKVIHDIVIMTSSMAEYVSVCTQRSVCVCVYECAGREQVRTVMLRGEGNDQDGLFFSQACQTCSSAACQCQHKAERLEYISSLASYRSAMTGMFFNYQASLLSLSLSVTHTNTHTCAHACVPVEWCMFTVWLHVFYVCVCVYGCFLWTFHTLTCLFVC